MNKDDAIYVVRMYTVTGAPLYILLNFYDISM